MSKDHKDVQGLNDVHIFKIRYNLKTAMNLIEIGNCDDQ